LAGEAACRWYINETIPEINAFRSRSGYDLCALFMLLYQDLVLITVYFSNSCPDSFRPVIHLPVPQMTTLQQQRAVPRKRIPLTYLLKFNFFEKR
jgi:hypothetical protein